MVVVAKLEVPATTNNPPVTYWLPKKVDVPMIAESIYPYVVVE